MAKVELHSTLTLVKRNEFLAEVYLGVEVMREAHHGRGMIRLH